MNCRRVQQLLPDDLDGLLREPEADRVAAHLRACDACRRRRVALAAFEGEVRQTAEWQPDPRRNLQRSAVERWITERGACGSDARRGLLAPVPRPSLWLASLAAATALLVAVLSLHGWQRGSTHVPGEVQMARRTSPGQSGPPWHPAPSQARHERKLRTGPSRPNPRRSPDRSVSLSVRSLAPAHQEKPDHHPVQPAESRIQRPSQDGLARVDSAPLAANRSWASHASGDWDTIESTVRQSVRVRDDFVEVPFPRVASTSDREVAAAVESYQREAAVVDARLTREVTVQQKATAFADLCERLRSDTGIALTAGPSVADEKVTILCEKLPLREVMRQLSRPFGYTWLRSGKAGEYKYELVQDLRSQLLEEELRNRDRNEALLALDRDMERYRPYLGLSPDEALARSKTALPAEKPLLEKLGNRGWGPIQIYFRLSRSNLQELRAGKTLIFAAVPGSGEQPLPPELGHGVLECLRDVVLTQREGGYDFAGPRNPGRLAPTAVPGASARVRLFLNQREPGRFTVDGASGMTTGTGKNGARGFFSVAEESGGTLLYGPVATGISRPVLQPDNASANARLARDPALRVRATVSPRSTCVGDLSPSPSPKRGGVPDVGYGPPRPKGSASPYDYKKHTPPRPVSGRGSGGEVNPAKLTSANVLEALHQATGLPIVADYFTRLFKREDVVARNQPLFDALNRLADGMRLRWSKDGQWLQFRSTSYYDDRLKEVPNRLLARWAASRRERGALTLDELIEIVQLSDAQLDAADMAEGARDCFGLKEWDMARDRELRPHLHYLAELTPAQRMEAQSATGLPFGKMSLAQQQRYLALALGSRTDELQSLQELAGATLRLAYTQPGGFEWRMPGSPGWLAMQPSPVRERDREAALQAARRLRPQVDAAEIVPTELAVELLYACSQQLGGYIYVIKTTPQGSGGYDGRPHIDPDLARRSLLP